MPPPSPLPLPPSQKKARRPGAILVASRPHSPAPAGHNHNHTNNSNNNTSTFDLTRWYEKTHLPEMLATGGVRRAGLYALVDATAPDRGDEDGDGDGGRGERKWGAEVEGPSMPFLAVYSLDDMGWLHEEGCGFWRVRLYVELGDGEGRRRGVFELAEFETRFWEVVAGPVEWGGEEGRGGREGDGDEELARNLVLTYLGAKEVEGKDVEGLLRPSWLTLGAAGRVRSTLLRVDVTRPGQPSVKGTKSEDKSHLEVFEERYLCLHEVSDAEINMSKANGLKILKYALLHAS